MDRSPSEPRQPPADASPATRELLLWVGGDAQAAERLLPYIYQELRALAGRIFRGQRADQTLQPTALVHEAFLRLVDHDRVQVRDRAHFMALAATVMRQILTDHARRRRAQKRGGDQRRGTLVDAPTPGEGPALDLVVLDEVLVRLERVDPRQHRIVELRFFAGLEVAEVAALLGVSDTTIEREWRAARAWLGARIRELGAS